jgi:integrase
MRRIHTDADVANAPSGRTLTEFPGLYIHVSPKSGLRSWVYRYSRPLGAGIAEKRLGRFPYMNLQTASVSAMHIKGLLLDRIDPKEAYQWREKSEKTFKQVADEWIATQRGDAGWLYTANLYLHEHGAALSNVQMYKINKDIVDKAISPLRLKHPVQARRVIKMWARVFDYAEFKGYRAGPNPAQWKGKLELTFPASAPINHHKALHYSQAPGFIKKLRVLQMRSVAAWALELLVLTSTRTSEVLEARWDEFDLEGVGSGLVFDSGPVWVIPAHRMKARKEHRVPLSPRAVEIIKRQLEHRVDDCPFVFTGYGGQTPLSKKSMYRIACGVSVTAHGFRATFRNWAGENGYPWEVCEAALAHTLGNRTAQAYNPAASFEKRRELMEAWAKFCG